MPNTLRAWRKKRGMTQLELGERLGITEQMVGYLERGTRQLTDHYRKRFAQELGIDVADTYLPGETTFTVPAAERDFWADYLALEPRARLMLREQAKAYREWQSEPADEGTPKRA